MSTPVDIAAGIGKAGLTGVLIKEGIHLKNLGRIKTVAFDKTGTLTKGKPVVTDVVALNGNDKISPDKFDLIGGAICLIGVSVIMYWPRG